MSYLGFWADLPRGFRVLAPMEDVTDLVFRDLILAAGRPEVFFTEFISVRNLVAREREALRRAQLRPIHQPVVAQIWGTDPEAHYKAAELLVEMGFSGIDINMGCPEAKITKKGACSALILNPNLAAELIQATKDGIGATTRQIPLSVKTRIGFSDGQTDRWCGFLLDQDLAALSVHGRIAQQMSEGSADWTQIARVVELRNQKNLQTKIIGNGDLANPYQLSSYPNRYGVDGVMAGRGIFENPFLFARLPDGSSAPHFHDLDEQGHLFWARKHLKAYEDHYGAGRNYEIMKKFFKIYLRGYPGAEDFRPRIMETHSYAEAWSLLEPTGPSPKN
ncbi:MAG: tRNA-dihydrouridine synthase [Spirochaetales bacterium]|nr:tRNA-dihydrouridine synthase [Spirochaetales bacterium]